MTGKYFDDNPTTKINTFESKINPLIKGYSWSNMAAVEHSKDNSCENYCPIGKYNQDAYLAEATSTKDPCFCLGIDKSDPTYPYCFCSDTANSAKFPCNCFTTATGVFTTVPTATDARVLTEDAKKCNCNADEKQSLDEFRLCKIA